MLLAIFSGTKVGSSGLDMAPFISALHLAFAVGVVASVLGAVVSVFRGHTGPGWTTPSSTKPVAA